MIETILKIGINIQINILSWLPHGAGVYVTRLKPNIEGYGPYYSQWQHEFIQNKKYLVNQVRVNNDTFIKKATLDDCSNEQASFFYDYSKSDLYVHFVFDTLPEECNIKISLQSGFSYIGTKESISIDGVKYEPRIVSMPKIKKSVDKFQVGKMKFSDQSIQLANGDGALDSFITDPIPGTQATVMLYDTATKQTLDYYTGFVSADSSTYDVLTIKVKDKRRSENIKIPRTYIKASDYPDIEDSAKGKLLPEGYGTVKGIKCYPLNGNATYGDILFKFSTDATAMGEVRVKKNDVWVAVTPVSTDINKAEFTLARADAKGSSGQTYECAADVTLRAQQNPGDIIADMNKRYNLIDYDNTNYDKTEWEAEKAKLADVSLLMDKEQEFFKWIEALENGSNYFFVYDINGSGKRVLRISDPNRALKRLITYGEIIDAEKKVERDFAEYASSVTVGYDYDNQWRTYKRVHVNTYEKEAIEVYGHGQDKEFKSLLRDETQATFKAQLLAEDTQRARPVLKVTINETDINRLNLELYDIIKVNTSSPDGYHYIYNVVPDTITVGHEVTKDKIRVDYYYGTDLLTADYKESGAIAADHTFSHDVVWPDAVTADYTGADTIRAEHTTSEKVIDKKGRVYWGAIRGQLIAIEYDPTNYNYILTIRERPESLIT